MFRDLRSGSCLNIPLKDIYILPTPYLALTALVLDPMHGKREISRMSLLVIQTGTPSTITS